MFANVSPSSNKLGITLCVAFLACLLYLTTAIPSAYADEKMSYDDIIREYNLQVATEVPENVKPVQINSEKELVEALEAIRADNVSPNSVEENVLIIEPNGVQTYTVDSYRVGVAGQVALKARVTTSGETITAVDEYTTFTGFTYGFDWEEIDKGSAIYYGTDFEAWAVGELKYYVLISGILYYYTEEIDLYGYIAVFH